jgi:hypothetical protein
MSAPPSHNMQQKNPKTAVYETLNHSQPEIRLLEIAPSAAYDDRVQCSITTFSLDEQTEYLALSYVWGEPNETEDILLEGQVMSVRKNLNAALKHLRAYCRSRLWQWKRPRFWVDAICINQGDIGERNHQVQLMGTIYSNASLVIAWLGMGDPDAIAKAMKIVKSFANDVYISKLGEVKVHAFVRNRTAVEKAMVDGVILQGYTRELDALFDDAYWTRIWVLQEMALARKLLFMCAKATLKYEALERYMSFIEYAKAMKLEAATSKFKTLQDEAWLFPDFDILPHLRKLGAQVHQSPAVSRLAEEPKRAFLKEVAVDFLAHDPRDQIFAIQALEQSTIPPDYNKSTHDVYCDYAKVFIEQNCVSVFKYSSLGYGISNDFNLPTWVPNWHELALGPDTSFPSNPEIAKSNQNFDITPLDVTNTFSLSIDGCVCDVISDCGPGDGELPWDFDQFEKILPFIRQYISRAGNLGHPMSIPPIQAVLRTLLTDVDPYASTGRLRMNKSSTFTFLLSLLAVSGDSEIQPSDIMARLRLGMQNLGMPPNSELADFMKACNIPYDKKVNYVRGLRTTVTEKLRRYEIHLYRVWSLFRLFTTNKNYIGWAPPGVQCGDLVCVLSPSKYPVILRQQGNHYVLVGICFVYGLMYGEAAEMVRNGKLGMQRFEIH